MKRLLQRWQHRDTRLFLILMGLTGFDLTLLGVRLVKTDFDFTILLQPYALIGIRGVPTFLFLVWNLFLAWIPYWLTFTLPNDLHTRKRRWSVPLILVAWLLFLPNAPYLLTDLLHLKPRYGVPHWYDVMLLSTFGFTGLMLGWISLQRVQIWLSWRLSPVWVWSIILSCLLLCGYGVFIGRFQRWNTWDVLTNPFALLYDVQRVLFDPIQYLDTFGLGIVFAAFLTIGYLLFHALSLPVSSIKSVRL